MTFLKTKMCKNNFLFLTLPLVILIGCSILEKHDSTGISFSPDQVEKYFNKKMTKHEGFYKIAFPRTDLDVSFKKIKLKPSFSHTSWLAFMPTGSTRSMMMGDMVLLDKELPEVLKKLKDHKIKVTAIHNHLAGESPPLKYMHIAAVGPTAEIAKKMKDVFSVTGTPLNSSPSKSTAIVDWKKVEDTLGKNGKKSGDIAKFGFSRQEQIKMHGHVLPKTFGIHTAIAFQMIDKHQAVITGDYVMTANEVDNVISTLTENGITATALHNHMIHESPRLFYMHFLSNGNPEKLAKGLKKALQKINHE